MMMGSTTIVYLMVFKYTAPHTTNQFEKNNYGRRYSSRCHTESKFGKFYDTVVPYIHTLYVEPGIFLGRTVEIYGWRNTVEHFFVHLGS